MNIVMVEDFFHPSAGYQLNVLCPYLVTFGHKVHIVCGEIDLFPEYLTTFFGKDDIQKRDLDYQKDTGVTIIRVPLKGYFSGRAIMSSQVFKAVKQLQPDILFVHGNDSYTGMQFTKWQQKNRYPLVLDSHMLDMASRNRLAGLFRLYYRMMITPLIIKNRNKVIRTVDDPFIFKHYRIPQELSPVIGFGSNVLRFHEDGEIRREMRKRYAIDENEFVVIYAGKLDEYKGGIFLAQALQKKFDRPITFMIIGNASESNRAEIECLFKESENRILRFPTQVYHDLPKWFQMADLAVFPKQCSLTFYDVLACGLPVIIENNSIGKERAAACEAAFTFEAGDEDDFRNLIMTMATLPKQKKNQLKNAAVRYILENYNYEEQARKYEDILKKEYEKARQLNESKSSKTEK